MKAKNMNAPKLFLELELINSSMAKLAQEMVYYEYYDFVKHASFKAAWEYYNYVTAWRQGKFEIPYDLDNKFYDWLNIFILPFLIWLGWGFHSYIYSFLLWGVVAFLLIYFPVSNSIKLKNLDIKVCFILNSLIKISQHGYSPSTVGISITKLMFETNPNHRYKPTIVLS